MVRIFLVEERVVRGGILGSCFLTKSHVTVLQLRGNEGLPHIVKSWR